MMLCLPPCTPISKIRYLQYLSAGYHNTTVQRSVASLTTLHPATSHCLMILTTPAFCPVPLLLKRPRPPSLHNPSQSRTHRCCHNENLSAPSNPSLAKKVESVLLASEQAPDVPPEVQPAPRVLPVSLDLLNYHARVASRRRVSYEFAARLFRRCITASPSDGRAWLGLARLYAKDGNIPEARRTFQNAVNATPPNPFILQAWGVFEERQSNLDRAKELYMAALRADPSHAPTWVALGLWHQRHEKNVSSARVAFRRGAEADPSNYYVWHVWGVLEKSCRRYPKARECFQKGLSANPLNAATYVAWGSLEDEVGNSTLAMKIFQKAHKVSPGNLYAYLSHAVAAEKTGDIEKARHLLKKAIFIRPGNPSPRQALGSIEFRQGDIDAARDIFAKIIQQHPKHTPSWHAWARVECAVGNYEHARKLFQEAVWAAPRSPHVVRTWHSWAVMEMGLGRYDTARRYFAHGLDVDSRSVVLLTGLAELEAREGNISRARESMERCVRLEPWRKHMWRQYQQLEAIHGSTHRAQLVYERSVVIGQQVEERFNLSQPLPGDFQGSGMWIDALDLPPDKSAFDSLGSPETSVKFDRNNSFGISRRQKRLDKKAGVGLEKKPQSPNLQPDRSSQPMKLSDSDRLRKSPKSTKLQSDRSFPSVNSDDSDSSSNAQAAFGF